MKNQLFQYYILALRLLFAMAECREPSLFAALINLLAAAAIKRIKALGWKRSVNAALNKLYPVFQTFRMVSEL